MSTQVVPAEQMPAAPVATRIGQGTAVEQSRAVAEVQAAIIVAQQCPRSITTARTEMQLSCDQMALAERAFYSYRRAGSTIAGPSVHLARELARCWGNIQYGVNELRRDDDYAQSEMQAWAWDVQTNARSSLIFIVPHKRDKDGATVDLAQLRDIYENNANQGARRLREAIFAILPAWFTAEGEERCQQTIRRGDGKPLPERIEAAVKAFERLGVPVARVEQKLGREQAKWNAYDLAQLTVVHRSIERGEVSIEDEFPQARVTVDEIQAAAPPPAGIVESPSDDRTATDEFDARADATPPPPKAMTQQQSRKLHALLRDVHGAVGDARFPILSAAVGREVTSASQISKDEATAIIRSLEAELQAQYEPDDPERPM